jgi:hypothetical protein
MTGGLKIRHAQVPRTLVPLTSYLATRLTSTQRPRAGTRTACFSSKSTRPHPLPSGSSSRISARLRGRLLANKSRRPFGLA